MVGTTESRAQAKATVAADPRANKGGITMEFVVVDPDKAREWLESMAANRRVSRVNLEALTQAMEEGRWHNDGTPIRFNKHGQLIDGQHRLWALINTDRTEEFIVMWGVDERAMTTLDTGKTRSRGDVLMIHDPNLTNVNQVAAATTIMLRWEKGARNNYLRNQYVSNDDVVEFYDKHREEVVEATKHAARMSSHVAAGSVQAYALCYWLFSTLDVEDAEFFWDRVIDGQALEIGSPIYALRELLRREARQASTREKMRADILAALMIKAWNAYRRGEDVRLLHFKVGGAHPEKFPEPV